MDDSNSRAVSAMSEAEIMRRHALYQRSFLENVPKPTRCKSPVKYGAKTQLKKRKQKSIAPQNKFSNKNAVIDATTTTTITKVDHQRLYPSSPSHSINIPVDVQNDALSTSQKMRLSLDQLEDRRVKRSERVKPWQENKAKTKTHKLDRVQLFYDRQMPPNVDKNNVTIRARKYVANSKYGNIYEIRETKSDRRRQTEGQKRWIWEDEFQLWLTSREKYLENHGVSARNVPVYSVTSFPPSLPSTTNGSVRESLPTIKEKPRPSAELYALYHSQRLHRTIRRQAAITVQRVFRGWKIRNFIKKLKRKAVLEHGRPWLRFVDDYRELVSRVRGRHGLLDAKCDIDLKQIERFMNNKMKYERVYRSMAPDGKLPKEDLMLFFNKCDLWPTQKDVDRSFDTIFRGSRNTAEVIFLLDCSTSTGVVGFHNVIRFVKDLVHILDIAPDRTRVGLIPYNEHVFSSFGLTDYHNKKQILDAISIVKLWHGLTRTDVALKMMKDMFQDSRPGVQKVGIVITDGQSTDPDKTRREAQKAHEMGIEMFSIGIGSRADHSELLQIATTPENVYHVLDVKSLGVIRRQIEKRFCLNNLTFAPIKSSRKSHVCRPVDQSEALDVLWSTYPPDACALHHLRTSRWIRPIVDGKEAWSMMDDNIIRATGIKACLKLVIQSKLQKQGYVAVPSDVKDDVEYVTSESQVLQIIERFIEKRKALENHGTRGRRQDTALY